MLAKDICILTVNKSLRQWSGSQQPRFSGSYKRLARLTVSSVLRAGEASEGKSTSPSALRQSFEGKNIESLGLTGSRFC